jgi:PAS domain S-box-containing protein
MELDEVESVAQIGSYALDIESGRWLSSRGLDGILGIDRSYARTVEGWAALIHPDDREAMVAYFLDEVLGQRGRFDRQYRIIRLDTGVERWVHGLGALDLDPSGRPVRMVGTIADVTDRRLLEAQNQRLAQALVQTDAAVLIARPTGELDFANPAFERLVGLVQGERFPDALRRLTDELPVGTGAELARTLSSGGTWSGEIAFRRGDGSVQVAEASISPILGSDGAVEGSITVARDVTERREEMRERDRLATAVVQAADGIVITDRDWRIVYANPAYSSSVGLEPSDLVGRAASEVAAIGLDPATLAEMAETVRSGQRWAAQVDHRRPDGSSRRLEVDVSPTRDPDGEISSWVGVIHDVTERVEAIAALTASESRLRTALDTMLEGVTVTTAIRDENGRIADFRFEYANAASGSPGSCSRLRSWSGSRRTGRWALRCLRPGGRVRRALGDGRPLRRSRRNRRSARPDGGASGRQARRRYVLSVRDVTAQYRSELQMRGWRPPSSNRPTRSSSPCRREDRVCHPAFRRVTGTAAKKLGRNPRILRAVSMDPRSTLPCGPP